MPQLHTQTIDVAGAPVFYRHADWTGVPTLYLHSIPTSSDDWLSFLEHEGGIAPDLLGFGRSSKAGNLQYALPDYVEFLEAFLDQLEIGELSIVGHGWGAAIALAFAQRHTERIERLAIIDAVPLLEGFAWPPIVRHWRRPGFGELLMGSVNEWLLARTLRAGAVSPQAWSQPAIDAAWQQFDQGTQRAILRLHRSIDPTGLAAAGAELRELWAPTLVLWGEQDPWLDPSFGDAYASVLPHAELDRIDGAGHWPWLDHPELVGRVTAFIANR